MSLLTTIERARAFLERNRRVSLRVLKLEFGLNDEQVEALIAELVDVQQVAALDGKVLSWLARVAEMASGVDEAAASLPERARAAEDAEAERRQLTVMFCDLVSATELSRRLDAEELRELVVAYQEAAAEVIARYEGHVAQYLGDGLLAYFGWPRAHEDDAGRAVWAGREILPALEALSDRIEPAHGLRLAVRVGIHTGPVVVGVMGSEGRSETLALGNTPNIAARLQAVAEPGTVVISDATLRLVPGMFATRDLGTPALKGIAEPIRAHAVLQATGVKSRLDLSGGRLTPLVGRQAELGVLADAWEHVVEGRGQTVLVSGEAGLGKSRLCHELRTQLAGEPHTWLECRCSPYTAATAFHPIVELIEQALAFDTKGTPAEKLRELGAGLSLGGFSTDEAVPLLAEWLGLPESAGYTRLALGADAKRHMLLETLAAWTLKLSELQPLVALVEDLHWCDPSSLELLGRLVAQNATSQMLLVGTARPEFESPWPARENLQQLLLVRLTKRQTRAMIASVSAAGELPEAAVEQLVARADGVPLFAEELTQAVVEAKGTSSGTAIPMTLQDSLFARLDRLSSAKEVAQRASVLGREFSYALLAATSELDEGALRQGLARLAEAELLFVRGEPPVATYTFKHALVQEAAYATLLKRTRQQLHARVADVLAAEFPERAAAEPELVARHAEAAGRVLDAIAGYERAGDGARTRSAYEEAIRHQRQAIALLATSPESRDRDAREAALQLALSASLAAARGYTYPEVETACERACTLHEAVGDDRGLGWALSGLSSFAYSCGQVERASVLSTRVLAIAEKLSDADLALRGHVDAGVAEDYRGQFASSLAHLDEALARCEPGRAYLLDSGFSITDPYVLALGSPGIALFALGWPDRALSRTRAAAARAREIGHAYSLAHALMNQTIVHLLRRDVAAQRDSAAEAMALAEAQGFPFILGLASTFHAAARVVAGEPDAVADLLPGLAQSGGTGSRSGAPGLFSILTGAYLAAGQHSKARDAAQGGLALAEQTGQRFMDAELHRLHGEIVLASGGAPADAQARFEHALGVARAQQALSFELRAATGLARLWRDQGHTLEARDLLQPVYARFSEGFDTQDLRDAEALLGELA